MNSKLFEKIGMADIDLAYIFIGLAAVALIAVILSIVSMKKLSKVQKKYNTFMKGNDGKSLEEAIDKRFKQVDELLEQNEKKSKEIEALFENMKLAVQKVGIVKYDAFNEMGGKLSFALVMLDKENNGFVINAMHSREGCYTYIKEIIKGESYIPLGTEEKEALDNAMGVMEE